MPFATCPRCRQEMVPGGSCKPERGVLRWGEGDILGMVITWPCHDCNAAPGYWHHAECLQRFDSWTGEQL